MATIQLTCASINYDTTSIMPNMTANTNANAATAYIHFQVTSGDFQMDNFQTTIRNVTSPVDFFPGSTYTLTITKNT